MPLKTPHKVMVLLHALLYLTCLSSCFAAKFVTFPALGGSHYLVHSKLAKELESRGHQVVISISDCESFMIPTNNDPMVRLFKCPEFIAKANLTQMIGKGLQYRLKVLRILTGSFRAYCDAQLSNQELVEEIKSADLIVGDATYLCSFLIADKFSLPHVTILTSALSTATGTLPLNLASLPSYIPQGYSALTDSMSFTERAKNTLLWLVYRLTSEYMFHSFYQELKEKHNITPEKSLQQTFDSVDIIIVQTNFAIDYPRPLLPNTKMVGPILPGPPQPLPEDLEEFMMGSGEDGVIVVSFGTIVSTLDDETLRVMVKALSSLSQRVIWKLKTDGGGLSFGSNVRVSSWLPQNDILGHPKTRLFIGHTGMNGMLEAVYHGVPMICMPFFGDQFDNAVTAERFGIGKTLYPDIITEEGLIKVINFVLNNQSYRENAARVSRSMRLRPRTSVQEAADWVEYMQALGGLPHLRPRSLDLPFYKLYLLDVLAVGLLLTIGIVLFFRYIIKSLIKKCCKEREKEKSY